MSNLKKDDKLILNDNNKIPVIALGVYLTPQNMTQSIVYHALKLGYRHIDCAQLYENEKECGKGIEQWINESPPLHKREKVFYVTKIFDSSHGYKEAKESLKKSFSKVEQLKYIDMVLIHSPQSNKEKRLGTWKALQEAVKEGYVKSIGVSNYGVAHLKELLSWEGLKIKPVVNQIELNPWLMRKEIVDFCKSNDIVLEAYSPLTQGRKLEDPQLIELSKKYKKSPAQILIRWSLQQGFVVLPKSSKKERAKENLNVFDFNIDADDMNMLSHPNSNEVFAIWDPVNYEG